MTALVEDGFRCVAYDRRGHGRSSQPGGGYDYDTLADDLAAVLDALDLRDVTLVGMSMAGGEITRYLTRHGRARVARVVYVSTAATPYRTRTPDNPDGIPPEMLDAFVRHQLLRDYPQWIDDNRAPFFLPDTPRPIQEWVRGLMLGHSLKALVDCTRSMATTDFRAELPRIRVPALLVHGTPRRVGADRGHRPADRRADPGCAARRLRGRAARPVRDAPGSADRRPAGLRRRLSRR